MHEFSLFLINEEAPGEPSDIKIEKLKCISEKYNCGRIKVGALKYYIANKNVQGDQLSLQGKVIL